MVEPGEAAAAAAVGAVVLADLPGDGDGVVAAERRRLPWLAARRIDAAASPDPLEGTTFAALL